MQVSQDLTVAEVKPMTCRQALAAGGRQDTGPVCVQDLERLPHGQQRTLEASRTDICVDLSRISIDHLSLGCRSRATWKEPTPTFYLKLMRQLVLLQ